MPSHAFTGLWLHYFGPGETGVDAAPADGGASVNGSRTMRQVGRAFVASGGRELSTSELIAWVYPRRPKIGNEQRRRIRRAAYAFAELVRIERRGRSFVCVWRPVNKPRPRPRLTGRLWWQR
jgi:hypothetical protein